MIGLGNLIYYFFRELCDKILHYDALEILDYVDYSLLHRSYAGNHHPCFDCEYRQSMRHLTILLFSLDSQAFIIFPFSKLLSYQFRSYTALTDRQWCLI